MGRNILLTEDTRIGKDFYTLLCNSDVIKGMCVYDTGCSGKGSGGYAHSYDAFMYLCEKEKVSRGDTLYVAIDMLYPLTDETERDMLYRNQQVLKIAQKCNSNGIVCRVVHLDTDRRFAEYCRIFVEYIEKNTIEQCLASLLRWITVSAGQHSNFSLTKTGVIGKCWRSDCMDVKNDERCGSCFFADKQKKIKDRTLYKGRLRHLVNNSLIGEEFKDCIQ